MINIPSWSEMNCQPEYPSTANYQSHSRPWPAYLNNKSYPFKFNNTFTHPHEEIEGDMYTTKWCQGDCEELYNTSLQTQPSDWRYRNKEITYTVNRHGYRTKNWEDIDWKNSVVLLGDSCTFGIGVGEDETIGHFLEKKLKRPVVNLGYGSGSNQMILETCVSMLNMYGAPYAVCTTWSSTDRLRYYTKMGYLDLGAWTRSTKSTNDEEVDPYNLWLNTFINPYNELAMSYNISSTMKALLQDKCKYVSGAFSGYSAYCTLSDVWVYPETRARDLVHPGFEANREIADFYYHKIK